jgi:hypothetical protein
LSKTETCFLNKHGLFSQLKLRTPRPVSRLLWIAAGSQKTDTNCKLKINIFNNKPVFKTLIIFLIQQGDKF